MSSLLKEEQSVIRHSWWGKQHVQRPRCDVKLIMSRESYLVYIVGAGSVRTALGVKPKVKQFEDPGYQTVRYRFIVLQMERH